MAVDCNLFQKTICIIGNFGSRKKKNGGQVLKTIFTKRAIASCLSFSILKVNSFHWFLNPFLIFELIFKIRKCDAIVLLTAKKGIKVFLPLITIIKNKKSRFFISAIGGWLPELLNNSQNLLKMAMKADSIWVETNNMIDRLKHLGLNNVVLVPNFKPLTQARLESPNEYFSKGNKFVVFSRVTPIKGINEVIDALYLVNKETSATLDIFGPIDKKFKKDFFNKISDKPYIQYCGNAPADKSVEILQQYFALIFPTKYSGEGIPATLIDAFFSGIPIISSKYPNYCEVLNENNSILYEFDDFSGLVKSIFFALNNKEYMYSLKKGCIEQSLNFSEQSVGEIIINLLKNYLGEYNG